MLLRQDLKINLMAVSVNRAPVEAFISWRCRASFGGTWTRFVAALTVGTDCHRASPIPAQTRSLRSPPLAFVLVPFPRDLTRIFLGRQPLHRHEYAVVESNR